MIPSPLGMTTPMKKILAGHLRAATARTASGAWVISPARPSRPLGPTRPASPSPAPVGVPPLARARSSARPPDPAAPRFRRRRPPPVDQKCCYYGLSYIYPFRYYPYILRVSKEFLAQYALASLPFSYSLNCLSLYWASSGDQYIPPQLQLRGSSPTTTPRFLPKLGTLTTTPRFLPNYNSEVPPQLPLRGSSLS